MKLIITFPESSNRPAYYASVINDITKIAVKAGARVEGITETKPPVTPPVFKTAYNGQIPICTTCKCTLISSREKATGECKDCYTGNKPILGNTEHEFDYKCECDACINTWLANRRGGK